MTKRDWVILIAVVGGLTALMFFVGCQESSVSWQPYLDHPALADNLPFGKDPNAAIKFTGDAADKITETLALEIQTAQGRQNMFIESLLPYYGGLFVIGLAGVAVCLLFRMLKVPSGRFFWIAPVVAFGGMAFIHFWSDYARIISLIFGAVALGIFVWKVVEWKWERNEERLKRIKGEQK